MNEKEKLEKLKQEHLNMEVPAEGLDKMRESIDKAKLDKRRLRIRRQLRNVGAGAAAALLVAVALPNMNADIAHAMGRLPVIGGFFRVVTLRNYTYEDENNSAEVKIPQVSVETPEGGGADGKLQEAADRINLDIEKTTAELIEQFEATVGELDGEGHVGLEVGSEVVTDNDRWFTLKLTVLETQASGFTHMKFYTVDKQTGEVVTLKDLFGEGSGFEAVISENIKEQMRARTRADEGMQYFLDGKEEAAADSEFKQISGGENFYWNSDGELTVVFDEYDVAPGYMGVQEFVIPQEVTAALLK